MSAPHFLDQRLTMRQLRLVRALAEHGGVSAAARYLALSQPALTKALQELERLLGHVLFERLPGGVRPTSTGRVLIVFAERTLADLERLSDQLDRLASPGEGLVVLGALPVTAAGLLPRLVTRLRRDHPRLELRMVVARSEEMLPKLAAGELDMVVGRLYPTDMPDGLTREPLYDEPISVIARAGHPVFQTKLDTSAPLSAWDVVLPTFGQRLGREIEHLITSLHITASPRLMRSTSHLLIRELLHESDTITIAPRMLMAGGLVRGSLAVVPIALSGPPRPAGLITHPNRQLTPSADLVSQAIRAAASDLSEGPVAITNGYGSRQGSDGGGLQSAF